MYSSYYLASNCRPSYNLILFIDGFVLVRLQNIAVHYNAKTFFQLSLSMKQFIEHVQLSSLDT